MGGVRGAIAGHMPCAPTRSPLANHLPSGCPGPLYDFEVLAPEVVGTKAGQPCRYEESGILAHAGRVEGLSASGRLLRSGGGRFPCIYWAVHIKT